jgi:hypothetical protein
MSKQFSVIGLISVLCLAVVMTACGGTARVEEKSTESVIVTRPSRVVIENFNGTIDVSIGAADKVSAEVTKFTEPGTRDSLRDIEFGISQDSQTITVKAGWPQDKSGQGNTGVDLKVSIPAGSPLQAVIGNGNITYHGALGRGNYDFEVGNGKIELTLPADTEFDVNATVGNGDITSEFPLSKGTPDSRVIKGTVGSNPDALITATTGNGRIDIRRGN